jgi:hypothetical protein
MTWLMKYSGKRLACRRRARANTSFSAKNTPKMPIPEDMTRFTDMKFLKNFENLALKTPSTRDGLDTRPARDPLCSTVSNLFVCNHRTCKTWTPQRCLSVGCAGQESALLPEPAPAQAIRRAHSSHLRAGLASAAWTTCTTPRISALHVCECSATRCSDSYADMHVLSRDRQLVAVARHKTRSG